MSFFPRRKVVGGGGQKGVLSFILCRDSKIPRMYLGLGLKLKKGCLVLLLAHFTSLLTCISAYVC